MRRRLFIAMVEHVVSESCVAARANGTGAEQSAVTLTKIQRVPTELDNLQSQGRETAT